MQHVSREQLTSNMRGLATQAIRERLASGELTPVAQEIALEELRLRETDAQEPEEPTGPQLTPIQEVVADTVQDFLHAPFGWSWGMWLAVIVPCVAVVAGFGTKARNQGDQAFLYVVILLQGMTLAGIIRSLAAVFRFNSVAGLAGKIVALGLLAIVLFGLSVCSLFAQSGWRGG